MGKRWPFNRYGQKKIYYELTIWNGSWRVAEQNIYNNEFLRSRWLQGANKLSKWRRSFSIRKKIVCPNKAHKNLKRVRNSPSHRHVFSNKNKHNQRRKKTFIFNKRHSFSWNAKPLKFNKSPKHPKIEPLQSDAH